MKHCIIYAHPNSLSFTYAVKQTIVKRIIERNESFAIIDLYGEDFNPVLSAQDFTYLHQGSVSADVEHYQKMVTEAEHLIFIYPLWWFGQPAILKGWIDRVFSYGFAYQDDENGFTPLLTNKRASLFIPMGSSKEILEQYDMQSFINSMIVGTLNLVGITDVNYQPFYSVPKLTEEERVHLLDTLSL